MRSIRTLLIAVALACCGGSRINGSGSPASDAGRRDGTLGCGDPGDRCCGTACNAGLTCVGGQCVDSPDAAMDSSDISDTGPVGDGACTGDSSCGGGRLCCQGACIDPTNDPGNCGACGVTCGAASYCGPTWDLRIGACLALSCLDGTSCDAGGTCCGNYCCAPGQICCVTPNSGGAPQGRGGDPRYCLTPSASEPTCAPGCPLCI